MPRPPAGGARRRARLVELRRVRAPRSRGWRRVRAGLVGAAAALLGAAAVLVAWRHASLPARSVAVDLGSGPSAGGAAGSAPVGSEAPDVRSVPAGRSSSRSAGALGPTGRGFSVTGFLVPAAGLVRLAARRPGIVEDVLVEVGDRVQGGQVLVRLDGRAARAALAEARAQLAAAWVLEARARSALGRSRRLAAAGLLPAAELERRGGELDLARARVRELEALLEVRRTDLDATEIRAPSEGVVLEVSVRPGEAAVPGARGASRPLIVMADLRSFRVRVDVHESELGRVRVGQPATVELEGRDGPPLPARTIRIHPEADRQRGTVAVDVAVLAADAWLRPGATARVRFP